jgi:hypothetical protein
VVLPGGQCDYDCNRGLVCGGGGLDGWEFAYYNFLQCRYSRFRRINLLLRE